MYKYAGSDAVSIIINNSKNQTKIKIRTSYPFYYKKTLEDCTIILKYNFYVFFK